MFSKRRSVLERPRIEADRESVNRQDRINKVCLEWYNLVKELYSDLGLKGSILDPDESFEDYAEITSVAKLLNVALAEDAVRYMGETDKDWALIDSYFRGPQTEKMLKSISEAFELKLRRDDSRLLLLMERHISIDSHDPNGVMPMYVKMVEAEARAHLSESPVLLYHPKAIAASWYDQIWRVQSNKDFLLLPRLMFVTSFSPKDCHDMALLPAWDERLVETIIGLYDKSGNSEKLQDLVEAAELLD